MVKWKEGIQKVEITDGTYKTKYGFTGASQSNVYAPIGISENYLSNGNTWDAQRGNTEGTLLTNTGRPNTTNTANQINYNSKGVVITLKVNVAPPSENISVSLRFVDPVSGDITATPFTSESITVTGTYRFIIYPGSAETKATANLEVQSIPLPRTWLASVNHSGTGTWAYSLAYSLIN